MSQTKIRDVALSQFASYGYEGASLSKIAEEVGIKKPTIYSHYKGKDDLFLTVVRYVFQLERRKVLSYFKMAQTKPLKEKLEGFFSMIEEGFNNSYTTKFLLRVSFFPPAPLMDEVMTLANSFIDGLHRLLIKLMKYHQKQGEFTGVEIEEAALAYVTMVDGVLVELLFAGNHRFRKRVDAAFPIYWSGIHCMADKIKEKRL